MNLNYGNMFQNKLAKLVLIIQIVHQSLTNNITSYFASPDHHSVLLVNTSHNCSNNKFSQDPFDGIQLMIDHLLDDYQSDNGKLSKKPQTIILTLSLGSANSTCYLTKVQNIYNPFVLGKQNKEYKHTRNEEGDRCCFYLENTYDLQLIIEGSNQNQHKLQPVQSMYEDIQQTLHESLSDTGQINLHYFPTIKITNIMIEQKPNQYHHHPLIAIQGYDFGQDTDMSLEPERLKRFRNSQLMFQKIDVRNIQGNMVTVKSTYNQINFTHFNITQYSASQNLIYIEVQDQQIAYSENGIDQQQSSLVDLLNYNFSEFLIISQLEKQGVLLSVNKDWEYQDNRFQVNLIIDKWKVHGAKLRRYEIDDIMQGVSIIEVNRIRSVKTQIDHLRIEESNIEIPFLVANNVSRFDNISIQKNIFQIQETIFQVQVIKSQNVFIGNNTFHRKFQFLSIKSDDDISKELALKYNYKSHLINWSIQKNQLEGQWQIESNDDTNEFILYNYHLRNQEKTNKNGSIIPKSEYIISRIPSKIEQLKRNIGLEIDGLIVNGTVCKLIQKDTINIYQNIRFLYVSGAFHFQLSNSKFTNNQYTSSNVLNFVSYAQINQVTLDNNESPFENYTIFYIKKYCMKMASKSILVSYIKNLIIQNLMKGKKISVMILKKQLKIQQNHKFNSCFRNEFTYDFKVKFAYRKNYDIPYFFKINGYHNVQIDSINIKSMSFEQSLFKIPGLSKMDLNRDLNVNIQILNISNIQVEKEVYLKPSEQYGSALIHVQSYTDIKLIFQNSNINDLKMYQHMYLKDDMGLVIYFKQNENTFLVGDKVSKVTVRNISIANSAFQYRKGFFVIQAQKVQFQDITLKNNQYQEPSQLSKFDKFKVEFDKMKSKGCIMDIYAQRLEVKNMSVDNSQSEEATILKMNLHQPRIRTFDKFFSKDIHLVKIQNSTFTNIISHSESILFDINLEKVLAQEGDVILSFDGLKVENVFSVKSGPIFKIYNMKNQKINISNSQFRSFKAGSGEYLIQYLSESQYQQQFDKQGQKLMFLNKSTNSITYKRQKAKVKPKLIIDNCLIDNIKVINRFINQLQLINSYSNMYMYKKYQYHKSREYLDKLMAYTDKTDSVYFDDNLLSYLNIIQQQNKFIGRQLISVYDSILIIRHSRIQNIETLQKDKFNNFPLVLKVISNSSVSIQNTSFSNLNPNIKGLFEVKNSKFRMESCRFSQIYDLHPDSFGQQIKQQKWFLPDQSYNVYNVFDNDRYKRQVDDQLKGFKGGLLAYNSTLEIVRNVFERMQCRSCKGLVLEIKSSLAQIRNNRFSDNSGWKDVCILIRNKQIVDHGWKEVLREEKGQYMINDPEIDISNNSFSNNYANNESACISVRNNSRLVIQNNRFENNEGWYGSCLYISMQKVDIDGRYDKNNIEGREIVTYNNHFINNKVKNSGQVYYNEVILYNLGSNVFLNNKAQYYSSKVYSYPRKFRMNVKELDGKDQIFENQYTLNNFPSNLQIIPLEFLFYDETNQQINMSKYSESETNYRFSSYVQIKNITTIFNNRTKNSIYKEQKSKQINEHRFTNQLLINKNSSWINRNLQITGCPLSQVIIELKTPIIKYYNQTTRQLMIGSSFKLVINFRECQIGEYYDKEQNYCQKCPNDTFSFNISEACQRYEKVELMEHAYGEYKTSVKKGAWRYINNTKSIVNCSNPVHCQPNIQKYPDASNSSGDYLCRTGHVGPLCQSCDHYGEFWGQSYQYSVKDKVCVSCTDSNWIIIFFFLFLVFVALFTTYTVNKQVVTSQNMNLRQKLKNIKNLLISKNHRLLMANQRIAANKAYCKMKRTFQNDDKKYPMKLKYKQRDDGFSYDVYVQEGDEKTKQEMDLLQLDFNEIIQPTALIKIAVTYLLIFSITLQSTKDHFKDLNGFQQVFRSVGEPVKQTSYSLECLIISLGIKEVPVYVIKDILMILTPLLNWLVFILIWKLVFRGKVDKPILINSLTFITFYDYPQIIRTIFPAVIRQKQDGIEYVQSDPKFIYNSQQQFYLRVLFYIPVLVMFLVVLPWVWIYLLKKNKDRLHDVDFKMKFGFIYQEYRKECYYIEFIKVGVKVLIIMIQSVYIESLQVQISMIQQIMLVYLLVIIIVRPYIQHTANTIELYNIILCLFNMILVNSIYWSNQNSYIATTVVLVVAMVVANIAFILVFTYFLFKQKIIEVHEKIIHIKHLLISMIPKLQNIQSFKSEIIGNGLTVQQTWRLLFRNIKNNQQFKVDNHKVPIPLQQQDQQQQVVTNQTIVADKKFQEIENTDDQVNRLKNQQLCDDQVNRLKNQQLCDDQDSWTEDVKQYVQAFKKKHQNHPLHDHKNIQITKNEYQTYDRSVPNKQSQDVQDIKSTKNYDIIGQSMKIEDIGLQDNKEIQNLEKGQNKNQSRIVDKPDSKVDDF